LIENLVQLGPRQRDDVLINLSGPISGKNNIADRGLLGVFLNELTGRRLALMLSAQLEGLFKMD
jgi:hypothetical protein